MLNLLLSFELKLWDEILSKHRKAAIVLCLKILRIDNLRPIQDEKNPRACSRALCIVVARTTTLLLSAVG